MTDNLPTLPRDLKRAASTLGEDEVRFLVDTYYRIQEHRKSTANQNRALTTLDLPHATLYFFFAQFQTLEDQVAAAIDEYSKNDPLAAWARLNHGVGPVIAAGLRTHIDIRKAPTAGNIWSFAGLNPNQVWRKGEKRPYNADLKVLCWKLGDSFVKTSGSPKSFYGGLYRQRKEYEVQRDEAGGNSEAAATTLATRTFRDAATRKIYESGHLPPGRLDLRARRWAVKLFLAAYHKAAYRIQLGQEPPKPYAIEHLGHAHELEFPHMDEAVYCPR